MIEFEELNQAQKLYDLIVSYGIVGLIYSHASI
jgi:hypothetical protein